MRDQIRRVDGLQTLDRCEKRALFTVQVDERVGWDTMLDLVVKHIRGLQSLRQVMSHHGRECQPCPLCNTPPLEGPLLEHILSVHQDAVGLTSRC